MTPAELKARYPDHVTLDDLTPRLPGLSFAARAVALARAVRLDPARYGAVKVRVAVPGTERRPRWFVSKEGSELLVADLTKKKARAK